MATGTGTTGGTTGGTTPGAGTTPAAAPVTYSLNTAPYGFGTGTLVNNRAMALLNVRSTKNA